VYLILLLVGAFGFVAMTVLGMAHGAGGHRAPALSHPKVGGPHAVASHVASARVPIRTGMSSARSSTGKVAGKLALGFRGGGDPWQMVMAISPIDIFSVLLGVGATGILLKLLLAGIPLAICSAFGGALFTFGVIRPVMGFFMRFASRPSEGLEGEVSSIGEATSRFDSNGRGLVKLILDEQVATVLATLDESERESGVRVSKGDKVVIISVDASRNTCVVSRELAPSTFESSFTGEV
jgi:hypothetical protein